MRRIEQVCVIGLISLFALVTIGEIDVFTGTMLAAMLITADLIG